MSLHKISENAKMSAGRAIRQRHVSQ